VNRRAAKAGVFVVSGALMIELMGEGKAHAEYNVPAPSATVVGGQINSNVASYDVSISPMNYQTTATHLIRVVKG